MITLLSYFAFLTSVLAFTLALFVGLNKIQILWLSIIIENLDIGEKDKRGGVGPQQSTY